MRYPNGYARHWLIKKHAKANIAYSIKKRN